VPPAGCSASTKSQKNATPPIMKTVHAFLLLFLALPVAAADLELSDGRIFKDFRIISQTHSTVMVRHARGMAKVDKALLPPSLQDRYPIDREAAASEEEKAQAARAKKQAAEDKAAAAEAKRIADIRAEEIRKNVEFMARQSERLNPTVDPGAVTDAVRRRAERYFNSERQPTGNNSSLKFTVSVEIDPPKAVPGWKNRFDVIGVGWYQYFDSKGASFASDQSWFAAVVQLDARGRPTVVSFSPLRTEPQRAN
jgi:hypothetical protein